MIKLAIIAGLLAMGGGNVKPKHPGVMVISKSYDIFYFRVKRSMIGGEVKVYDDKNHLVGEQRILTQKNIIDFFEALPGNYTIRVKSTKGESEFHYRHRKHTSTLSLAAVNSPEDNLSTE